MLTESELARLRSPISRGPLRLATVDTVKRLNDCIRNGTVADASGRQLVQPVEAGVVEVDGSHLFPVRQGIVLLVPDRAIRCAAFQSETENP